MSVFDADVERLEGIAEQVLAGTPIEEFELGEWEIEFVVGYTSRAIEEARPHA